REVGKMKPQRLRAVRQPEGGVGTPAERLSRFEEFEPAPTVSLDDILRQTLEEDAAEFADLGRQDLSVRSRMQEAWGWVQARIGELSAAADSLSEFSQIRAAPNWEQRLKKLYAALRRLNRTDDSFDLGKELPAYAKAAEDTAILGKFDVVTYG